MGKQAVFTLVERGGRECSNTVEGFFSLLKCGVVGTFHHISEAHLVRYLAEFDFRYSNRIALGSGLNSVFPAKARIQIQLRYSGQDTPNPRSTIWTPAFAGDTDREQRR